MSRLFKYILVVTAVFLVVTCQTYGEEFRARITFYANDAVYGSKTASGAIAKKGLTVAAHPKYKFGTKLFIPELAGKVGDGNFVVQDRGPAVTKGTASGGKTLVIDVYVGSHAEVNRMKRLVPSYMKVVVK